MVDRIDSFFRFCVFVCLLHPLPVVVEGGTGQLSDFKQKGQSIFLPQFLDCLDFFSWRCSLSQTKACKFFK